jgi:Bacterial RNA polymerase, alpha chain C terminal domain
MDWTFDDIATDGQKTALRMRESAPPATFREIAKEIGIRPAGARLAYHAALCKRQSLECPATDAHSQHPVFAVVNWVPGDFATVTRVANCLMRERLVTFEQVAAAGSAGLLKIPNIGSRSLGLIKRSLDQLGLVLAPFA